MCTSQQSETSRAYQESGAHVLGSCSIENEHLDTIPVPETRHTASLGTLPSNLLVPNVMSPSRRGGKTTRTRPYCHHPASDLPSRLRWSLCHQTMARLTQLMLGGTRGSIKVVRSHRAARGSEPAHAGLTRLTASHGKPKADAEGVPITNKAAEECLGFH